MPKLSRIEIDEALEEYRQAQAAIDQADPDFVEAAVYRQKAAECQLDALVRQAKVIQFPLARCESEVEESWQESLMNLMGKAQLVAAVGLGLLLLGIQLAKWLGWW